MKVLLINGSPNPKGSTKRALEEMTKIFEDEGVSFDLVDIGMESIRGCIGCRRCKDLNRCIFDDLVNKVHDKFKECDALVVGSPVYYASPNGSLISFLDRLFFSTPDVNKHMKVGASVCVARRAGTVSSFDVLNKYFSISNMMIATSSYWNDCFSQKMPEIEDDKEGLQTMRNLARNIVFLMKAIKREKEENGLPSLERSEHTNFIR